MSASVTFSIVGNGHVGGYKLRTAGSMEINNTAVLWQTKDKS